MTEIQGKLILVRVRARFELARVRVIGSQLYIDFSKPKSGAHIRKEVIYCNYIAKNQYERERESTKRQESNEHEDIFRKYFLLKQILRIRKQITTYKRVAFK